MLSRPRGLLMRPADSSGETGIPSAALNIGQLHDRTPSISGSSAAHLKAARAQAQATPQPLRAPSVWAAIDRAVLRAIQEPEMPVAAPPAAPPAAM